MNCCLVAFHRLQWTFQYIASGDTQGSNSVVVYWPNTSRFWILASRFSSFASHLHVGCLILASLNNLSLQTFSTFIHFNNWHELKKKYILYLKSNSLFGIRIHVSSPPYWFCFIGETWNQVIHLWCSAIKKRLSAILKCKSTIARCDCSCYGYQSISIIKCIWIIWTGVISCN